MKADWQVDGSTTVSAPEGLKEKHALVTPEFLEATLVVGAHFTPRKGVKKQKSEDDQGHVPGTSWSSQRKNGAVSSLTNQTSGAQTRQAAHGYVRLGRRS